tara:strand:+ start:8023 stop:9336 length:1314 start_codon:yes stop_codon:yes gene_type:complete
MVKFSSYKKDNIRISKKNRNWINLQKNLKKIFHDTQKEIKKNNKIKLMEPTYGVEEILAANEVLISTNVTMGKKVKEFENTYAKKYKFKYAVSCNSGSSANLLSLSVLTDKNLNFLKPGDEVIVSAFSWSTTIWPIIQRGLIPVFVDINLNTLNIDCEKISKAINKKTKAIMIVHAYGNPCEMDKIVNIAKKNKLILIEDCCEAMGAYYKNKSVGSFGDISTFSFYFSHHITTLEGGICLTNSKIIRDYLKIQRSHGWIREIDNKKNFKKYLTKFDSKFLFTSEGYNLRLTELQAAIGISQIAKINKFVSWRRKIAKEVKNFLSNYKDIIFTQEETSQSKNSYFGIAIIVNENKFFKIDELVKYLNSKNIETRPIICGNFTRQPGVKKFKYKIVGKLNNSDFITKNSFAIGCHQNITLQDVAYLKNTFKFFLDKKIF